MLTCYRCGSWPCSCADGIALVHGDNVATLAGLPEDSIDLVVTSPPYDNLRVYGGHTWDFEGVAAGLWRVVKPGGVIVWVVADATVDGSETGTSFRQALRFKEIGFRLHDTMIFERYGPPSVAVLQKRYEQQFEFMFVLSRGEPSTCTHLRQRKLYTDRRRHKLGQRSQDGVARGGYCPADNDNGSKIRGNIWSYVTGGGHVTKDAMNHPAMFPEALACDHILSWSNEGDTVLDPFNGSGTTTKMAKHTGRKAIGLEIEDEYIKIAANRLKQNVLFGI